MFKVGKEKKFVATENNAPHPWAVQEHLRLQHETTVGPAVKRSQKLWDEAHRSLKQSRRRRDGAGQKI